MKNTDPLFTIKYLSDKYIGTNRLKYTEAPNLIEDILAVYDALNTYKNYIISIELLIQQSIHLLKNIISHQNEYNNAPSSKFIEVYDNCYHAIGKIIEREFRISPNEYANIVKKDRILRVLQNEGIIGSRSRYKPYEHISNSAQETQFAKDNWQDTAKLARDYACHTGYIPSELNSTAFTLYGEWVSLPNSSILKERAKSSSIHKSINQNL